MVARERFHLTPVRPSVSAVTSIATVFSASSSMKSTAMRYRRQRMAK